MKKIHSQLVLVEFHHCPPMTYEFTSEKKITLKKVIKYLEDKENFKEDSDSILFIDNEPMKIEI